MIPASDPKRNLTLNLARPDNLSHIGRWRIKVRTFAGRAIYFGRSICAMPSNQADVGAALAAFQAATDLNRPELRTN